MTEKNFDLTEETQIRYRRRVVTAAAITLGFVGLVLLVYNTADVLLLLFISLLLAITFRSLAVMLHERTPLSQNISLGIVVIALLVLLVGAILVIGPGLASQFDQLSEQLPQSLARLEDLVRQYRFGDDLMEEIPEDPNWSQVFFGRNSNIFTRVTGVVSGTLNLIANLVLIFFTAIFFAAEPKTYVNGLVKLVPSRRRERAREILHETGDTLAKWLITRFVSMIAVGVMTTVGLTIIGMPLALTLGVFAGLFAFIPTFGPIIALIPAVLLALLDSPQRVAVVVGLYLLVQAIDDYLIGPIVLRRTVRMPPALIIAAQLVLSVLVGQLGLVLAAPLAVAGMTLVRMIYVEDFLERSTVSTETNGESTRA